MVSILTASVDKGVLVVKTGRLFILLVEILGIPVTVSGIIANVVGNSEVLIHLGANNEYK